jgi:hypothetical protein
MEGRGPEAGGRHSHATSGRTPPREIIGRQPPRPEVEGIPRHVNLLLDCATVAGLLAAHRATAGGRSRRSPLPGNVREGRQESDRRL